MKERRKENVGKRSELKEFRSTLRMGCLIMYWYLCKGFSQFFFQSSKATTVLLSHIFISFIDLVTVLVLGRIGEV